MAHLKTGDNYIRLKIYCCADCPYAFLEYTHPSTLYRNYCMDDVSININDGAVIPNNCPRLKKELEDEHNR